MPDEATMTIGGENIVLAIRPIFCPQATVLGVIREIWPRCIVEIDEEGWWMFYRDRKTMGSWDSAGLVEGEDGNSDGLITIPSQLTDGLTLVGSGHEFRRVVEAVREKIGRTGSVWG